MPFKLSLAIGNAVQVRAPLLTAGLCIVAVLACTLGRPAPDPRAFQTQVAAGVEATLAAAVTPARPEPMPSPTPVPSPTLAPIPSAAPPQSEFFSDARYALDEERLIGQHAIRVWRNTADTGDPLGADRIATISTAGQAQIQVDFFSALGALTGSDITGEGDPDVIIETFSGGAHCCFGTLVYNLGLTPVKVLESPVSNCAGSFQDLGGDGVPEFVTCDDLFAYTYCPYATSPTVTAVLQYEPGRGYVPAGPRFAELYAEDIQAHTQLAEQGQPGALGEWDETTKCAVLPLVLDYLYSGQAERAWAEFNRLYPYPDTPTFREEIENGVGRSALYAAP